MTKYRKISAIALAALTAAAAPSFAAGQGGASLVSAGSGAIMIVRNDYATSAAKTVLSLPTGFRPAAGTCYIWYPHRAGNPRPTASACDDAVIPMGAVQIRH